MGYIVHRVHTERRLPISISGVHPITMEKSALAGEAWAGGAHCRPTPFLPFTITYKVAVYAPAERTDTLSLFHLYPICTLWYSEKNPFQISISCRRRHGVRPSTRGRVPPSEEQDQGDPQEWRRWRRRRRWRQPGRRQRRPAWGTPAEGTAECGAATLGGEVGAGEETPPSAT